MTFHTTIRHQELVALLGSRNLYLRLVYAHIANYTQAKGAWCGTQRELATQLELPIATVHKQLDELIARGLIVHEMNKYCSRDEQTCSHDEQKCSRDEQKCSRDEQKCSRGEQNRPPLNPLYNNYNYSSSCSADKSAEQQPQQPPIFFEKDLSIKFDYTSPVFKLMPPPYPLVEEFVVKHKQYPKRLAIDFWTYNEARGWRDRNGALYKDWGCLFVRYLRKE